MLKKAATRTCDRGGVGWGFEGILTLGSWQSGSSSEFKSSLNTFHLISDRSLYQRRNSMHNLFLETLDASWHLRDMALSQNDRNFEKCRAGWTEFGVRAMHQQANLRENFLCNQMYAICLCYPAGPDAYHMFVPKGPTTLSLLIPSTEASPIANLTRLTETTPAFVKASSAMILYRSVTFSVSF